MNTDWLKTITPGKVLKWGGVVFAYALAIIFVINVVWATVEGH